MAKRPDLIKLSLSVLWLAFTVAFATWWFLLSVGHIERLSELEPAQTEHWIRQRRMILWEGTTWLVLLALGGGALIALVQRETLRVKRIREFFASFSHEVKTSLASLRLQAESLKDDLAGQGSPILDRLIGDTVRLQVQLENSLFFASQDGLQVYMQPVSLARLISTMREQWPGLKINAPADFTVNADERALRTIFSNLLQNAIVHGRATEVSIETRKTDGHVIIAVSDNGEGYQGDVNELGQLFYRPKPTSGSGLGLYISRVLLEKMNGRLDLKSVKNGFAADVVLELT